MSRLTNVIFNLDGWLNSPRLQMNLSPQTQPMEVKIHTTHTYRNPVNSECLFQSTWWDCDCVNIECYSEESDDEDEADTAEMCAEYMDQLTPGSLHVSNHTLYANLNRPITVSI